MFIRTFSLDLSTKYSFFDDKAEKACQMQFETFLSNGTIIIYICESG